MKHARVCAPLERVRVRESATKVKAYDAVTSHERFERRWGALGDIGRHLETFGDGEEHLGTFGGRQVLFAVLFVGLVALACFRVK